MGEILCKTSEFVIQIITSTSRQHIKFVNIKKNIFNKYFQSAKNNRSNNLSFILHVYNTLLGHKNDLHPMLYKTKSNYFETENINTNVHLQVLQNQDKSNANNNDRQHIYPVFGSVELKITVIIFFGYLSMTGNLNFLICSSNLIKYCLKKTL